jgi:hypothetical protein
MDLHNINITCPCRCKEVEMPGEEKRIICKSLLLVFLASCIFHLANALCIYVSFTLDQIFLCCRNTFVRRSKSRMKECA